jgi:hypothetical protein
VSAKPKTAIVEQHHYVLDWFEISKEELDLEHTVYEFNYRFGPDWYLEATRYDPKTEKWEKVTWKRRDAFRMQDPGGALAALGDRVTKFSCISTGMQFYKALADIISRAETIKARQVKS